ncbi:hypothetical protein PAXRUDRAFT_830162 [Paxillus rubicundulus Ve08.2h10]|uniref:Uncharacterized protein n=1 Tax=Paxillus rubicundulus Ve08.2h10 TaxID=930991 RepID=A0A0D0E4K8_9AGAM|nr:hypothetical protein PAXRUDRAFT_830162 [Paxillus rubicundulus Ve08.2h10]
MTVASMRLAVSCRVVPVPAVPGRSIGDESVQHLHIAAIVNIEDSFVGAPVVSP